MILCVNYFTGIVCKRNLIVLIVKTQFNFCYLYGTGFKKKYIDR